MKKFFSICCCLILIDSMYAQSVSINTDGSQPNASAMLDIKNTNKGLLIPRVNLLSETDVATIPSPVTSLLVFNTNAALPDGLGFYFWNSNNKWSKLATVNASNNISWGLSGNSGIDPNTQFIGTTDNQPLVFKTNNILSGKIDPVYSCVYFGQHSGEDNTSGFSNSAFGFSSLGNNTTGWNNTASGTFSLFYNTTGQYNSSFGSNTLYFNTNGAANSALGYSALYRNTIGVYNSAVGSEALVNNSTGSFNSAMGRQSMHQNTTGRFNSAFGNSSMAGNTTGDNNAAFGYQSLAHNTTGYYNAAFGSSALNNNTNGDRNAAFGLDAMLNNVSGYQNTACGNSALKENITGDFNTAIGYLSGPATTSLNNTTALGYQSAVSTGNTMVFGNSSVDRWAFGLTTTNANHAITVGTNFSNGNGAYLTQGGNWTNASSRIKKDDFSELNSNDLLQKISQLSIQKWKYKGTDEYHIGPVAEDFFRAFGLGIDDKGISTVDPAGIALAAIQEQQRMIEKQNEMIIQLEKRIEMLEKK